MCVQIAFAAADSVTGLKLIEAGLPSERIALMALPMVPIQVTLPWIIRYDRVTNSLLELVQSWFNDLHTHHMHAHAYPYTANTLT